MAMDGNSNMISSGWGMSNRTYMKLFGLRDGNGNKVYPEMAQGLLKGYPVQRTSAIPANLGTGVRRLRFTLLTSMMWLSLKTAI